MWLPICTRLPPLLYLLYLLDISQEVLLPALLDVVELLQIGVDWLLILLLVRNGASGLASRWFVHSCYSWKTQSSFMLIIILLIVLFLWRHLIEIILLILLYFKVLPQSALLHLMLRWHHIIMLSSTSVRSLRVGLLGNGVRTGALLYRV